MLDHELAERLIGKLVNYMDYNVNLMDEKGIIIASTDKGRVGSFHEIAYNIMKKSQDIVEVEDNDDFLGVRSGINMALEFEHKKIGVVGVTGDPDQVRNVALVVRMAVESMLEYEIAKEQAERRRSTKDKFLNDLLYEEEADRDNLEREAEKLGYLDNRIRIPMMVTVSGQNNLKELIPIIKKNPHYTKQDILTVTKDEKLLLFAGVSGSLEHIFNNYKYLAGEYLSDFLAAMRVQGRECSVYVGSLQSNFVNYRYSYRQCLWLERHVKGSGIGVYFYDHIDEYLKSQIPIMELHKIFGTFQMKLDEEFKQSFIKHIGTLYQNNYNLEASSKVLFIHKNTMAFRLDKIKNLLGINPIQNSRDRDFADYLCYYLKRMN